MSSQHLPWSISQVRDPLQILLKLKHKSYENYVIFLLNIFDPREDKSGKMTQVPQTVVKTRLILFQCAIFYSRLKEKGVNI